VIAMNLALENQPEQVNHDAFGEGWIVRLKMDDPAELNSLMDAAAYDAMLQEEKH